MRNVKVYFNDYGFKPVNGETVAGFYIHRNVQVVPSGAVKNLTGWAVTDPNSGKRIGGMKTRDAARNAARSIRKIFDECGIQRSERERDILTKVSTRVQDVINVIKSCS
jgi:hypothetical protein